MTGAAAVDLEFAFPHMAHAVQRSVADIDDLEMKSIPFALYAHF